MAEWSKALAWKVSIRQKRIEGSNPSRSAIIRQISGMFPAKRDRGSVFAARHPQRLGERLDQIGKRGALPERDHDIDWQTGAQPSIRANLPQFGDFARRHEQFDLEKRNPVRSSSKLSAEILEIRPFSIGRLRSWSAVKRTCVSIPGLRSSASVGDALPSMTRARSWGRFPSMFRPRRPPRPR